MQHKKLGFTLAATLLGLAFSACSEQANEASAPADDTVVHTAETAAGSMDELLAKGEQVYLANCSACHQPNGEGLKGAFPPLAQSDYLDGDRKQVLAAAMFGLSGPITVNGVEYNGVMPSLGHLPDEDLAAALTYVFSSWATAALRLALRKLQRYGPNLARETGRQGNAIRARPRVSSSIVVHHQRSRVKTHAR